MALTDIKVNNDTPQIKKELFPFLCRVCMSQSKNMKCVFSTEGTRTIEELEFCTGTLIDRQDGLPTKLCELCLATLAISHKFKTLCLRSDEILRKVIMKQNVPNDVRIKTETDEAIDLDHNEYDYQDLETKQEVDIGDDVYGNGDELMCDIGPRTKSKIRTRLKTKTKRKMKSANKSQAKTLERKNKKAKKEISKETFNSGEEPEEGLSKLNCSTCNITFSSQEEKIGHTRDRHDNCDWICEVCGKTFKHRSSHYSHIRSHLPPTHQCDRCDYRTWHKADLNKHLRMHNGIKNYVCEYCTKGFHNSSNLRGHIRRNHSAGAVARTHVCPRCDHAFYAADKLRRHMDTHDNIKRFECTVCHDRFSRRCQWKIHLKKLHNISIPRLRPGRPKLNVIVGTRDPPNSSFLQENSEHN